MKATKKKIPSIKQLNAKYAKATPAERRRMIARDALSQLKAEKFTATCGVWARVFDNKKYNYPMPYDPLQPILLKNSTTCECCGTGAIFLSYVRLANNANYRDAGGLDSIQRKTDWPSDNLRLIELAFEQGMGQCTARDENEWEAVHFGEDFGPTERLTEILKNIARSKEGLFTP